MMSKSISLASIKKTELKFADNFIHLKNIYSVSFKNFCKMYNFAQN